MVSRAPPPGAGRLVFKGFEEMWIFIDMRLVIAAKYGRGECYSIGMSKETSVL